MEGVLSGVRVFNRLSNFQDLKGLICIRAGTVVYLTYSKLICEYHPLQVQELVVWRAIRTSGHSAMTCRHGFSCFWARALQWNATHRVL